MIDQRLESCGFQIAAQPFPGPGGKMIHFATRISDDRNVEYFTVDLCAGMILRSSARGATAGRWSYDDACIEFAREPVSNDDLTFLDRCRLAGFIRTQPTGCPVGEQIGHVNHWGSRGDGSQWLLAERSETLIRFDTRPWQVWEFDGLQLVPRSTASAGTAAVEQTPDLSQESRPPQRSMRDVPFAPVEHSGRNVQEALF